MFQPQQTGQVFFQGGGPYELSGPVESEHLVVAVVEQKRQLVHGFGVAEPGKTPAHPVQAGPREPLEERFVVFYFALSHVLNERARFFLRQGFFKKNNLQTLF